MAYISDIKLIRTDTTLDLSQKAEKGMPFFQWSLGFYGECLLYVVYQSGDVGQI